MRKRVIALLGIFVLSCGVIAGCQGQLSSGGDVQMDDGMEDLTTTVSQTTDCYAEVPDYSKVQDFSGKLFSESLDNNNPVLSPVSAYLALALTGEGAGGETAQEFQDVMGENRQAVSKDIMDSFPADTDGMNIMIANSAWIDDQMTPEQSWMDIAGNSYRAQIFQMDLSTGQTMQEINSWIKDQTEGKIKDFLAEPFDAMTRMVLFNTVYFKGEWEKTFEAYNTRESEFTLEDGETVMANMMSMWEEDLSYVKSDVCDGIVLPYKNSDMVFVALKPAEGMTVREMYAALDMEQIGIMVDEAQEQNVNLMLPKYEVTFDRILNDDLENMGLGRAFNPAEADFSGLGVTDSGEPLYISLVRQKAVFIVDEEGTEASAVTEVVLRCGMSMEDQIIDVFFDEPFLYMIMEPDTDVPLFMGIMDNPTDCGE